MSWRFKQRLCAAAAIAAMVTAASGAHAAPLDRGTAEADAQSAITDGHYTFCSDPGKPLSRKAHGLCPLASEIEGCEGFVKACTDTVDPIKPPSWWSEGLATLLSYLALGLVWVLVLGAVVAIGIAIARLLMRAKEDEAVRDEVKNPEVVHGTEPSIVAAMTTDAESLLRLARDHALGGRLDLALFTYLAAALRALDDRGAVRIARHRTHGEYVRGCLEANARPALRDLVRDVDVVRFGGVSATMEIVEQAAARALAIVRMPAVAHASMVGVATMISIVLLLGACGGGALLRPGADPGGDELLFDLLVREGATARHMTGSLASLPMIGTQGAAVIVDTEMTPLDDETKIHLVAWVEQGGMLVLAGNPDTWPKEFWAKRASGSGRDVHVRTPCPREDDACASPRIDHVRLARPAAMTWPHDGPLPASATLDSGELYGAVRLFEKGVVLGLASDELLTNAGLSMRGNAPGFVALLESLDKTDFLIARPENGVSPPGNPFAGLVRIGLSLGLLHALAFTMLLFLSEGIRHARPTPEPPPPRRAFAEHVRATAALYARAKATGHALFAYARFTDQQLRARAPRGTSPALFLAQRADADPKDTAALYARAMSASANDPPTNEDLLVLRRLSALFSKAMREGR
jgi:hypothetical protein